MAPDPNPGADLVAAIATPRQPLGPFKQSQPLTMGVELELQLISLSDFDLTPASGDMLALLARSPFPGVVTPEITTSMLEVATTIHTTWDGLRTELRTMRATLQAAAQRLNIGVCGGGTHPYQRWAEQRIYPKPRFHEVSALYGYLAQQFTIFGQHVHIGCAHGDDALYLLHALNRYVPHFIALAASSPFVQGHDTQFHSARLNSVFAFPLSGRAPFVLKWEDFAANYFERMARTGVVNSMKDFYWDIRPKPEYGTIELRVCDTPLDVDTAAALAGYLQALCLSLLERRDPAPAEDDYLVYTYNRFQACRFGFDGTVVHPKTFEATPLATDILDTLRRIRPFADRLGATPALDWLQASLYQGNGAQRLRAAYGDGGSLEGLVQQALERFGG